MGRGKYLPDPRKEKGRANLHHPVRHDTSAILAKEEPDFLKKPLVGSGKYLPDPRNEKGLMNSSKVNTRAQLAKLETQQFKKQLQQGDDK